MTRHRQFSNCRAMVLAGTLAPLCNARAFPVEATSGDWPEVNQDKLGTRYSPLASINTSNAKNLKKVCAYTFPDKEPSQSAPIAIGGVIYPSTARYTVALDAARFNRLPPRRHVRSPCGQDLPSRAGYRTAACNPRTALRQCRPPTPTVRAYSHCVPAHS